MPLILTRIRLLLKRNTKLRLALNPIEFFMHLGTLGSVPSKQQLKGPTDD